MMRDLNTVTDPIPQMERHELMVTSGSFTEPRQGGGGNQDEIFEGLSRNAFGVFDGMGGHDQSELASRLAARIMYEDVRSLPHEASPEAVADFLKTSLQHAREQIAQYVHGTKSKSKRPADTTATIFVITDKGRGIVAHCGDSRLYLFRGGKFQQITVDDNALRHPLVKAEMVRHGFTAEKLEEKFEHASDMTELTSEEQYFFNNFHLLAQSVMNPTLGINIYDIDVQPGDRYLLCTDGLQSLRHDEIIADLEQSTSPALAAKTLVTHAGRVAHRKDRLLAHPDDRTAIVIDVAKN